MIALSVFEQHILLQTFCFNFHRWTVSLSTTGHQGQCNDTLPVFGQHILPQTIWFNPYADCLFSILTAICNDCLCAWATHPSCAYLVFKLGVKFGWVDSFFAPFRLPGHGGGVTCLLSSFRHFLLPSFLYSFLPSGRCLGRDPPKWTRPKACPAFLLSGRCSLVCPTKVVEASRGRGHKE